MLTTKIPSGIEQVDQVWQGLYRGSTYLLYGRARYGRNLLALHLTRTGVEHGEPCLYVCARRPRDLAIQADGLRFDLDAAVASGRLRLLRIPMSITMGAPEAEIEEALRSLARFVAEAQPSRLVIEDFTPFVRTSDLSRLSRTLTAFFEAVGAGVTTTIVGLGEPGNEHSRAIVLMLRNLATGVLHLDADPEDASPRARVLTLLPPVGSLLERTRVRIDLGELVGSVFAGEDPGGPLPGSPRDAPAWEESFAQEGAGDGGVLPVEAEPGQARTEPPIHFFDIEEPWDLPAAAGEPPGWPLPAQDPLRHGHYVAAEGSQQPAEEPSGGPVDKAATQPVELSRADFEWAFDRARAEWSAEGKGFLALALRLDILHERAHAVPPLLALVRRVATEDAFMTSDPDGHRVAIILPGGTTEQARELLAALRQELFASGGEGALSAIATLVLPNGEPFPLGARFLAYVFEGE